MNPLLFSRLNVDSRWFFAIWYAIKSFSERDAIYNSARDRVGCDSIMGGGSAVGDCFCFLLIFILIISDCADWSAVFSISVLLWLITIILYLYNRYYKV